VVIMPWQLAAAASGMTCADEILGTHSAQRPDAGHPRHARWSVPDRGQGRRARCVGQVVLAVSEYAYFGSDSIAVRGTFRFGARIVDADRVVKLTIADD
jgi:hypothetical protein